MVWKGKYWYGKVNIGMESKNLFRFDKKPVRNRKTTGMEGAHLVKNRQKHGKGREIPGEDKQKPVWTNDY